MTMFDNPNREAVGLEPIWVGAQEAEPKDGGGYDPGDHTVDEVKDDVESGKVSAADALEAEKAGKNRTTLVDWLSGS